MLAVALEHARPSLTKGQTRGHLLSSPCQSMQICLPYSIEMLPYSGLVLIAALRRILQKYTARQDVITETRTVDL